MNPASNSKMRALWLAPVVLVAAVPGLKNSSKSATSPHASPAIVHSANYADDNALLRGEFERLQQSISVSSGSSIYTAYELGRPLARAAFAKGDAQLKRDMIAHAASIIRGLPTYGSIAESAGGELLSKASDSISPKIRQAQVALTGVGPTFDGLPLPFDSKLYPYRVFPLKEAGQYRINTGNIHQFGYYLSTLVRLGAQDKAITDDRQALTDLRTISEYLSRDFLRFFWLEAPAWHWSGPFNGGMRERSLARLNGDPKMAARRFFRGFLDYDMHVMAVAADLKAAERSRPDLIVNGKDREIIEDVNKVARRVIAERLQAGAGAADFSFDRGYWDDNPIAQYGGCKDAHLPTRPCPIKNYTIDISHAQRWPAWLESFSAAASSTAEREHLALLRSALAKRVARDIRYRNGRLLLTNFLDGRDGWFITTGSEGGHGAHPPSSLTGWAMRYGMLAELARLSPDIAAAQRKFCTTITSKAEADIRFRMEYYGEPEANSANGIRPQRDEYGPESAYAHICTMVELTQSAR